MDSEQVSHQSLEVLVHDERGIVYSGPAQAVSSYNEQGLFDILPDHSNFITLIKEKLVILSPDNTKKELVVAGGILHCYTSKVEIYLGVKNKANQPKPQQ